MLFFCCCCHLCSALLLLHFTSGMSMWQTKFPLLPESWICAVFRRNQLLCSELVQFIRSWHDSSAFRTDFCKKYKKYCYFFQYCFLKHFWKFMQEMWKVSSQIYVLNELRDLIRCGWRRRQIKGVCQRAAFHSLLCFPSSSHCVCVQTRNKREH